VAHPPTPRDTAGVPDPVTGSTGAPDPVAGPPAARGWGSWVVFAGLLLILAGAGHALEGVLALGGHTTREPLLLHDLTTWGVVHLVLALVMALTGLGLLAGTPAARVSAALLCGLSVLSNLAFTSAFPAGSAIVVVVDLVVIYAVTVHGGELRAPAY
jgi:uncharacterized membrane protein YtjA (UPF0391 family)